MTVTEIAGTRLLELAATGPTIGTEQDALDLMGETYGTGIDTILIPVVRLHHQRRHSRVGGNPATNRRL